MIEIPLSTGEMIRINLAFQADTNQAEEFGENGIGIIPQNFQIAAAKIWEENGNELTEGQKFEIVRYGRGHPYLKAITMNEPAPTPEIQRQLEFVEWLKSKGIYNPMESAQTMVKLQSVWEAMQPPESDLNPGKVFEITYPFTLDAANLMEHDGLGYVESWCPGTRQVTAGPYGESTENWAEGEGQMILTVVSTHHPGAPYRERVFYTRQWRDPDGRIFGDKSLRNKGKSAFMAMTKGFRYHYDIVDAERL